MHGDCTSDGQICNFIGLLYRYRTKKQWFECNLDSIPVRSESNWDPFGCTPKRDVLMTRQWVVNGHFELGVELTLKCPEYWRQQIPN